MNIKCVVCGEPWESAHIDRDAPPWVRKLFLAGAGCEGCEGDPRCMVCGVVESAHDPQHPFAHWEPRGIFDFENGGGDEYDRIAAWADVSKRPKWERPEPEVVWECDGCHVQVVTNPDFDPKKAPDLAYEWDGPKNGHCDHPGHDHRDWDWRTEKGIVLPTEPAHVFGEGEDAIKVCEECLEHCDECGEPICDAISDGDPCNPGWSAARPGSSYGHEQLCYECTSKICEKCDQIECECLGNVLNDLERKHDLDEDMTSVEIVDKVHTWLHENSRSTYGDELKVEDVEEALVALGYLVWDEEEKSVACDEGYHDRCGDAKCPCKCHPEE